MRIFRQLTNLSVLIFMNQVSIEIMVTLENAQCYIGLGEPPDTKNVVQHWCKYSTHDKKLAKDMPLSGLSSCLRWSRIHLQRRRPGFNLWIGKISWKSDRLPTTVFLGFPGGLDGKESACNVGDLGSIPGLGRPPEGGHSSPLKYSCLENAHGQGAWQAKVHNIAKSQTWLSD